MEGSNLVIDYAWKNEDILTVTGSIDGKNIGWIIINRGNRKSHVCVMGEMLVVSKEHRHKGYGKTIMDVVFEQLQLAGVCEIHYTPCPNGPMDFAKQIGFVQKSNYEWDLVKRLGDSSTHVTPKL